MLKTFTRKKGKAEQIVRDILNAYLYVDKQLVAVKLFTPDLVLRNPNYFVNH